MTVDTRWMNQEQLEAWARLMAVTATLPPTSPGGGQYHHGEPLRCDSVPS